jgi:arsenite methyltransferase
LSHDAATARCYTTRARQSNLDDDEVVRDQYRSTEKQGMSDKDRWARWLDRRRFGGDEENRARAFADLLHPIRDRVLDGAEPVSGARVLDVGCGEGMIGFGALDRGAAEVVFSDVSTDLLRECEIRADTAGVTGRCRFVQAAADDLGSIERGSVDVVALRSVLIYVEAKARCFAEFARVLAKGGRLSLFEPINRFGQAEWTGSRFLGADISPVAEIMEKVRSAYGVSPETDPMLDFDERDLVALAEAAGFTTIALTLTAEVGANAPQRWDVFVNTAANPNLPTLAEAMTEALTEPEQQTLTAYLRPLIEQGRTTRRMAHAYLTAVR